MSLTRRTSINSSVDKYNINTDTIEKDLTSEVPQWILSAYAPGRDAPGQLFGGFPREQSFEELRLHFMMGKAAGNEQQAVSTQSIAPFEWDASKLTRDATAVERSARAVRKRAATDANRPPRRQRSCRFYGQRREQPP